jgi:phosphoribosylformylglycinamidine (FGAM) synthase PurS component
MTTVETAGSKNNSDVGYIHFKGVSAVQRIKYIEMVMENREERNVLIGVCYKPKIKIFDI